ncbi:restriction endonuclease subunit S [Vibrio cholerae]|uniref:restriction endonuclease subunit S n=1 Tax=Vibrio cholerae TaxID=666 RepID=UPI0021D1DC40|nr:restriction endonuclease subunit S [Vibrio cholerae]MCU4202790.1 restriction endonuclease subunit S [Vibrio cholerae]MCU4204720.1 restriction endonuclease subunit S [Vibrio cholerae]
MSALELEIPKGYLKTEYGIFPSDWCVLTLDDVCSFAGGAQPEKSVFSYKEQSGYIRLIQIRDYKSDKDIVYIPEKLARKKCSTVDIMIGRYGPPIFQILRGIEGAYNVALIKATPKENIDREFLYYFLKNDSLFELMDMLSQRSSGQTGVELPALKSYPIGLPPIEEQTAIANALSDVDALISELEKLIAKKQAIKTATMQQLLTGRTRLPQFALREDGTPKGTKPSELGEIPEDWECISIGRDTVLKARIGWQALTTKEYQTTGDIYLVTGTDFDSGAVKWERCFYVSEWRYKQDQNIQLRNNDVLITKDGTIGKVGYVTALSRPATLNSGVFVVRPKNNNLMQRFLFYVLTSRVFDDFINRITAGSTITHLYQKDFVNFEFSAPCIEEQTAIATILSDMDAEIQALEQRLGKTRQIKQGMMQELLTGKTRLIKGEAHG